MLIIKTTSKAILFTFLMYTVIALSPVYSQTKNNAELKKEIKKVEKEFQDLLNVKGSAIAFYTFAADDAVIKRTNDTLIKGKEAIKNYYLNKFYENTKAKWEPDYIEVSEDGSMAYTYGKYEWEFISSDGKKTNYKGVFHTVWKRMPDKTWKYVWD